MGIAFRVDATSQIGTGHFMRCLTLAEELRKSDVQIRFISRGLPQHLSEMLTSRSIEFIALKNEGSEKGGDELAHSAWLGVTQAQDAKDTAAALAGRKWDWLIVDHYALDARWESAMREQAGKIMAIDDLADRKHDCDVLLDQNYYRDMQTRYDGKVPEHCRMLLGPRYSLLREEFRKLREQCKPRTGEVKRILLFFGGVDSNNYTGLAIEALKSLGLKNIEVDVVIGAQHPCRSEIEQACAAQGYGCHVQTPRMAELMAAADLAIGAGGTAIWERCCLGLPSLSICAADNQRRQLADAAIAGLLYSPADDGDQIDLIRRHAKCLTENASLLKLISTSAMNAVDGVGAIRVASMLGVSDIEIKYATESDSKNLFEWRNHQSIRSVSRNTGLLDWEVHCSWLSSILADKNRELLIGYIAGKPIGVVRFDKLINVAEVSIYLVPDASAKGTGRDLLLKAERWLKANCPEITQIRAVVLDGNIRSQKLFLGTDYQIEEIHYLKELKD